MYIYIIYICTRYYRTLDVTKKIVLTRMKKFQMQEPFGRNLSTSNGMFFLVLEGIVTSEQKYTKVTLSMCCTWLCLKTHIDVVAGNPQTLSSGHPQDIYKQPDLDWQADLAPKLSRSSIGKAWILAACNLHICTFNKPDKLFLAFLRSRSALLQPPGP